MKRGDRVALVCANGQHFVVGYLAALGLGAIAVPLNPQSPPTELGHQLGHVGASTVLAGPAGMRSLMGLHRGEVPAVELVVATEALDGAVAWNDVASAEPAGTVDLEPDELAVLLFTSGTAGRPQAAMLSHENLLSNIEQVQRTADRSRPDDVVFGVLPLFHVFGLNVTLGVTLASGACLVLVQRFDPATGLDTIRDRGVTIVPGAPPLWQSWASIDPIDPTAFASVRIALSGASKMPEGVAKTFRERFGLDVREGYGLTEASPVVTSSVGIEPKIGSIGVPIDGLEVRLVDAEGDDALEGDSGEIWVRGPNVFKGYWGDPEATARVLTPDGWLRTGDIAVADDDGYLYIVDRAKDLIIVSGFNVYPNEVEEVLAELPGVAEVAIVGVPHPHTGEAVKAYIVLDDGSRLDEEQVIGWAADHLARYKCPTKVLFVDQLPRSTSGKVLRRVLR